MAHSSRALMFAAALLAPVLCGCAPPTPETELNWGVNETPHHEAAARAQTHFYNGENEAAVTPEPRPAFYTPVAHCSCDDPVQTSTLPSLDGPAGPAGPVSFAWPVSGPVIADFGSEQSGARNDGINIKTTLGEPIHAAASGNVIYAGDELKGYGNLILLKHSDGYVTAYAHAERILVERGASVTRGQVIGYAGQTGDVSSPQLHFEIRRGVQPVNPRPLLVASR